MLEIGVLGKVDQISDEGMRFYALIGLCVSTGAAIEHLLFHCYRVTCGLDRKSAAENFYKYVQFKPRRDLADGAVQAALKDGPLLETWKDLLSEIQEVCGGDKARNLISHNPLELDVFVRLKPDGTPDFEDNSSLYTELAVNQSHGAVLGRGRRPDRHTAKSLREYAYAILGAELRLSEFYRSRLAHLAEHP